MWLDVTKRLLIEQIRQDSRRCKAFFSTSTTRRTICWTRSQSKWLRKSTTPLEFSPLLWALASKLSRRFSTLPTRASINRLFTQPSFRKLQWTFTIKLFGVSAVNSACNMLRLFRLPRLPCLSRVLRQSPMIFQQRPMIVVCGFTRSTKPPISIRAFSNIVWLRKMSSLSPRRI